MLFIAPASIFAGKLLFLLSIRLNINTFPYDWNLTLSIQNQVQRLSTDRAPYSVLNLVLFVLKICEILYKKKRNTTICIIKNNSTHKKYVNNLHFPILFFGFIRLKMDNLSTFSLSYEFVHTILIRTWS